MVGFAAILITANIFDKSPGVLLVQIANLAWTFYAATVGIGDVLPSFHPNGAAYLRLFGASFWNIVLVIVPPAFFIALALPESMDASGVVKKVGPLVAVGLVALAYIGWAGPKLSLSPVIALMEERRAFASLRASWAITKNAFWPTLLLAAFVLGVVLIVEFMGIVLIGGLVGLVAGLTGRVAVASDMVVQYSFTAVQPAEMYVDLASWIAYARFLSLLRSREDSQPRAVDDIPASVEGAEGTSAI